MGWGKGHNLLGQMLILYVLQLGKFSLYYLSQFWILKIIGQKKLIHFRLILKKSAHKGPIVESGPLPPVCGSTFWRQKKWPCVCRWSNWRKGSASYGLWIHILEAVGRTLCWEMEQSQYILQAHHETFHLRQLPKAWQHNAMLTLFHYSTHRPPIIILKLAIDDSNIARFLRRPIFLWSVAVPLSYLFILRQTTAEEVSWKTSFQLARASNRIGQCCHSSRWGCF